MTREEMERAINFLTESAAKHDAQIGELIKVANQDAENIRALTRVVEIQHERLTRLEDGGQQ